MRQYAWAAVIAALLVVIPASTYGVALIRRPSGPACPERSPVTVQVDPRIAAVVVAVLRDVGPGPECVPVQVDQRSSADLAYDISQPQSAQLSIPLPDVWIPDSSAWLATASTTPEGGQRVSGVAAFSIVTSPVVAALRRDTAKSLGWPRVQLGWDGLLAARGGRLKVAVTDAQTDGAGLLAVLAHQQGVGQLSSDLLKFTRQVTIPRFSDFKGQSPTSAVASGFFDAITASEQDVITHNRNQPDHPLVGEYDSVGADSFDFPFVRIADPTTGNIPLDKKRDEDIVQARLVSPQAERAYAAAGFRTAAGELDRSYGADQGVVSAPEPAPSEPFAVTVRQLQAQWPSLKTRASVLVVVDESGSMGTRLPRSRLSRMELVKRGLRAVVHETAPDSDMGLWTFTSSRRQDFQVRVPLGRVDQPVRGGTWRTALAHATERLAANPRGGTGLYDTTLAAFRKASQNFRFGRLNAVLIFTDGRNEDDAGSISLDTLLRSLQREFQDNQPVRILTFAYGTGADTAALARISAVTGGETYRAVRADEVQRLLTKALAQLSGPAI
jgi:Ca-activated chloride channel family protein